MNLNPTRKMGTRNQMDWLLIKAPNQIDCFLSAPPIYTWKQDKKNGRWLFKVPPPPNKLQSNGDKNMIKWNCIVCAVVKRLDNPSLIAHINLPIKVNFWQGLFQKNVCFWNSCMLYNMVVFLRNIVASHSHIPFVYCKEWTNPSFKIFLPLISYLTSPSQKYVKSG